MIVRLVDELDPYHRRRRDAHGWLYIVEKVVGKRPMHDVETQTFKRRDVYEARSVATGVVCTIESRFTERFPDDEGLQTRIRTVSGQAGAEEEPRCT